MTCILLRPEHKTEKEKAKANGAGFRTGFLCKGLPPVGWQEVPAYSSSTTKAYEKTDDTRNNVRLISFELELTQYREQHG